MTYDEAILTTVNNYAWDTLSNLATNESKNTIIRCMKEAALLYGEAKWNEACEEQTNELNKLFDKSGGTLSGHYTQLNLIKPPFKP